MLAARPSSIFNSIMHILSRQIGLISITLAQSGMDCALTSLPDHRWQRSSSPSLEKCPAGVLRKALWLSLSPPSRSGVFYHIHFTSHTPPLIHFRGKMNYLPPTVNTGIMENYKQSVKESAGFSLRAARVIVTPACFQTEISLCGRWKWHWRCIDWCSVVFHGLKSVGFLLFNEGLLRNFQTRKPSLKNTVGSVLLLKVNRHGGNHLSTLSVLSNGTNWSPPLFG